MRRLSRDEWSGTKKSDRGSNGWMATMPRAIVSHNTSRYPTPAPIESCLSPEKTRAASEAFRPRRRHRSSTPEKIELEVDRVRYDRTSHQPGERTSEPSRPRYLRSSKQTIACRKTIESLMPRVERLAELLSTPVPEGKAKQEEGGTILKR